MEKFTIDRLEGDTVVLVKKGDESVQLDVPRSYFPGNVSKGDIVQETGRKTGPRFQVLKKETADRKKQAEDLLNKLKNKNEEL